MRISILAAGYRELGRVLGTTAARARGLVERHPEVGTKIGGVLMFSDEDVVLLREAMAGEIEDQHRVGTSPSNHAEHEEP